LDISGPLVDTLGRVHTDLRISVTDRCNVRCYYCMPSEGIPFKSHRSILTFEEILFFVRVAARLGTRHVRLTGGEPLVRREIPRLVEMLAAVPGIREIAMTTNGILLGEYAQPLKDAGLSRLNISLDTLSREKFEQISRRDELPRVLEGIAAARQVGFRQIKLNALAIRGLTEDEVAPLARFAVDSDLELRFIEFMPIDGDRRWNGEQVLPGEEILEILSREIGLLEPVEAHGAGGPATVYQFTDGRGRIGVIHSVTDPFCQHCDRLRLTADGKIRNCLFSDRQWDARAILRSGGTQRQLAQLIQRAVAAKSPARGTRDGEFACADRTMHQIGG
jgi:cyclic pyranopterin phosphate synthase